ncbi:MAG TPA: cytochrome P460 family protein [Burkholderiaceae bacterium]|nr:cytochrome P460 family protein [Burkholderiaceae bacterium]
MKAICQPGSVAAVVAAGGLLWGCATAPPPPVKDGELPLPADYKNWPKFLSAVQRPDAKQVREIYMNPVARDASAAGGFPNGTIFVMENYAAKARADGTLEAGRDGKLVKGELQRVFVMGKNAGWGADVIEPLRNGSWVYAAWLPSGQKAPDDTNTCRACHLPLSGKDFVHRYDEHFASRP